jgi:hypothetical protein
MGEQLKNHPKTIIPESVTAHHPGDAYKRIVFLFKSKSASRQAEVNQPQMESLSAGTTRSSSRGFFHRANSGGKNPDPDLRLRAFVSPVKTTLPPKTPKKIRLRPNREMTRRAYWDVAAAFSLVVNAILVGALLVMSGQIRNLKTTMNGLLGGLYSNFVEMDKASITTTIPVDAQIPVVFSLPIQRNTTVTLTSAVPIIGAQVVINSGGLSINAPANVTLPAGTNLPIALNMDVPVQLTVPINLQVPVNIPLNQTNLHTPFTGLQQTIRPLYCTINKNAQYPQGFYICAEHDIPTLGTPTLGTP